ncbi:uncharacterized protein LOC123555032 [Mercenaria mercenaria]|uniref:uncharacterized protein LOC123555032 n=1 Tax=Mercenaria mercenaria TaxID=6596 RepID=UPI00234F345F|nr:uncharacterized protein LOC123555032 [Mercenaria mercenaria]
MVTLCLLLLFAGIQAQTTQQPTHNPSRPDIYGLINLLYLKADANLDSHITEDELSDVFKGFDKNGDGTVTNAEFVELWMQLTSQTSALANAYFHLADLNDDKIINLHDFGPIYHVFDLNHDGSVSGREFATKWEDIIRETPFAVLFERADTDKDEFLSHNEFRNLFSSFDSNSDGLVNNQEFDNGWSHADFALMSDADMLFADIDKNGDGNITGHSDMDKLFTTYDSNGDGKLALQEVIQVTSILFNILIRSVIRVRLCVCPDVRISLIRKRHCHFCQFLSRSVLRSLDRKMISYLLLGCLFTVSVLGDEGLNAVNLFHTVDINKDDKLTRTELDAVFLLFDTDNNTEVTPTEFVADWLKFNLGGTPQAQTLFTRADTNDDGVLDVKDVPAIFAYFDQDGNGSVDISEFLTQWGELMLHPAGVDNAVVDIATG